MNLEVSIKSTENWNNGGNGTLTIKNNGQNISDWQFQLSTIGFKIQQFWQFNMLNSGDNIIVKPPDWKKTLNNGETLISGFGYTSSNTNTNLQVTSNTPGINIISSSIPSPTSDTITIDKQRYENLLKIEQKIKSLFDQFEILDDLTK